MSLFYILNNAPTIEAPTAKEAARLWALQAHITSGAVTIAGGIKVFDITNVPNDVQVTDA